MTLVTDSSCGGCHSGAVSHEEEEIKREISAH